jgi:hypothetical protein
MEYLLQQPSIIAANSKINELSFAASMPTIKMELPKPHSDTYRQSQIYAHSCYDFLARNHYRTIVAICHPPCHRSTQQYSNFRPIPSTWAQNSQVETPFPCWCLPWPFNKSCFKYSISSEHYYRLS